MLNRRQWFTNAGIVLSSTIIVGVMLLVSHKYVMSNRYAIIEQEKLALSIRALLSTPRVTDVDTIAASDISDVKLKNENYATPTLNFTNNTFVGRISLDIEEESANGSLWLAPHFPRILIVGFGKSGTKALFEFLKLHPQLTGPERENRFFTEHYEQGLKSYLNSLPQPPNNGFVIEKSPDYIINSLAPHRIISSAQSLRIQLSSLKSVVVLRNPIDRSVSDYLEWNVQELIKGNRPLPPFEKLAIDSDTGKVNILRRFINTSCYAEHIQRWLSYFPSKQVCFVDGDEFIYRPYQVIHKLEECLELEPFFTKSNFFLNSNRRFYCVKSEQSRPVCMNKSKGRTHPVIPTEVFNKLVKYYKDWDDSLRNVTQRDWSWFNRMYI